MAELLLRLRDRELSRTPIRNTRLTLGRDQVSDVVIDNAGVSRTHAILIYVDEKFRIRDASQNGLTVNGKPVKDSVVAYGDVIGIGKFELVLCETAESLPLQAGSQVKVAAAKNVVGTLALDPAAAAKLRDDAIAKAAAQKHAPAIVHDTIDTVRPAPMPRASATAVQSVQATPELATDPSKAMAPPHADAPNATAASAVAAPQAPAPARRKRGVYGGVDLFAVLKLAGICVVVIVGVLAGILYMLDH